MHMKTGRLFILLILLVSVHASEIKDSRPDGITGETWQFGPYNRWSYTHIREILPTKNIKNNLKVIQPIPSIDKTESDLDIILQGESIKLSDAIKDQYIDGILAIKKGIAKLEIYNGTLTADRAHLMWSVSKTIAGLTAAGVEADGLIELDKKVSDYVPELAKSGWSDDTLRDILDMRDSSNWTESYDSPESSVRRQDCADGLLTGKMCIDSEVIGNYKFLPSIGKDKNRKGKFIYKSGTTDVMAWVLEAATGKRYADLVSEYLWTLIGAEKNAGITVDIAGFTLASGGMFATLRDTARIGLLMLNRGKVGNRQVIPEKWMDDIFEYNDKSIQSDLNHGRNRPYYRSFVWGLGDGRKILLARGVHGQFILISPPTETVIVMYSSWPNANGDARNLGNNQSLAILESINNAL